MLIPQVDPSDATARPLNEHMLTEQVLIYIKGSLVVSTLSCF